MAERSAASEAGGGGIKRHLRRRPERATRVCRAAQAPRVMRTRRRVLMVANAEWYFLSHRLVIAHALVRRGYEVVVAAPVERGLQAAIEQEGFRFVPIRMVRGRIDRLREFQAVRDLISLYRKERPHIIYQTTIKPILYGSLAARWCGCRRIINAIPGLGHTFSVANLQRLLVMLAYALALRGKHCRAIFQNEHDLELFLRLRLVTGDRAVTIRGSGVNVHTFQFLPERTPPGAPIALLASRLVWHKGIGQLVAASRRLRAPAIRCRVVIAGVPDARHPHSVPEAKLRAWHDEGLIEWWGLRGDMPELLQQSAIVALPTYYRQRVPQVLLDAAPAGRP